MSRRSATSGAELRALVAGIAAPADQRFRRPDSRPIRRRTGLVLSRIWKPAVAALAALALVGAAAGVLLSSASLAIDRIVVVGRVRMPAGTVERLLAGLQGRNILSADLDTYQARVLESPWVASASLWRVLPRTIEVRVVERVPVVLARLGQRLHLVDAHGVVMAEYGPAHGELDLPIVDGLGPSGPRGSERPDPERTALMRQVLEELESRPDLLARVSQIDVSRARNAVVLLDDDAAFLHLGEARFVERLQFYLDMLPTFGDQFQDIEYVDLRFEGKVAVCVRGEPCSTRQGGSVRVTERRGK